ncbi:oviduct-specific glycoprotein [Paramyrothecium foliicola]|nr:oviduct-specific glycoprotein [Paramyrothecium foliicola]
MYSQVGRKAAWTVASLCFLWLLFSNYVEASVPRYKRAYHQPNVVRQSSPEQNEIGERSTSDESWRDTISFNPAHQNPVQAPPQAMPEGFDLAPGHRLDSNLTSRAEPDVRPDTSGPLYCKDGPCIDGSCCGKQGICGYGSDFCGDGCTSQCNATAMCGEYSENAEMPCGMKLCCSATGWCGTTDVYCHNADPLHGTLPCQSGYGSCAITGSPSCAKGSGSSKGRTIGYYQSWNARERICNKVTPKQLKTEGYTHLFYSFAFINPYTYQVAEAHPDDKTLMREFTDLSKGSNLKTWIAIGGFDMSEPKAATHRTWSEMVATKANRAAFISSVKVYMDTYGFTGVDLDWEYPGAPERGGNKLADTRNFSLLLKEMKAAYGNNYGISLTLAPDYWYLRWFDAKAMEPYVDFFGFMAYDLHGSWDADVKALGKKVRGQADIREIEKNTIPLWFDGLNPAKINFGLALYGRGYTLADPSCTDLLCPFAGPSKPAPCTNFEGVMSLVEIEQLIKKRRLTPKYLPDSMMKQITWDDQWIGYDDEETFAAKRAFADGLCFGGTMIWSIDFQATGSGNAEDEYGEVVYLDPAVYTGEPAQCSAPCQFVLPPRPLSSKTTISIPPYVTSIEVKPGTTSTITIPVPPITTDTLEFYNQMVPSGSSVQSTFTPFVSLSLRPVTTTITISAGETQVRTLELPPWPAIVGIRPPNGGGAPGSTDGQPPAETGIPTSFPPPVNFPMPTFDVTSKPPFTFPGGQVQPTGTWPDEIEATPVPTEVSEEGDDSDPEHFKSSCKLWFFTLCISWPELNINFLGWEWDMPPGIWGPGPPPIDRIKWPPGFTIKGTLPPWPRITVGPGGKFSPPPKPDGCTPEEASICLTTLSYATTVSAGITRTTASQTTSKCATITGCHLRDIETTKVENACKLRPRTAAPLPDATEVPKILDLADMKQETEPNGQEKRATKRADEEGTWDCETAGKQGILVPRSPQTEDDLEEIRSILRDRQTEFTRLGLDGGWREVRSSNLGFTALFQLNSMGPLSIEFFGSDQVDEVILAMDSDGVRVREPSESPSRRQASVSERAPRDRLVPATVNSTNSGHLTRRDEKQTDKWFLSMMSLPEGLPFDKDFKFVNDAEDDHLPVLGRYSHGFDDSAGSGQTIYMMDTAWRGKDQPAISNASPRPIDPPTAWQSWKDQWPASRVRSAEDHGYLAAVYAAGQGYSLAPKAKVVFGPTGGYFVSFIEGLINVADNIESKDTSVVVMPFGFDLDGLLNSPKLGKALCMIMYRMEQSQGVSFVVSGQYNYEKDVQWPQMCRTDIASMIIVGSVDKQGAKLGHNGLAIQNAWAPGDHLQTPVPDGRALWAADYSNGAHGTSFAAPLVAGLVAYMRGLEALTPAKVHHAVTSRSRVVTLFEKPDGGRPRVVWNGYGRGPVEGGVCSIGKRGLEARQSCEQPGNGGGSNNDVPSRGPPVEYKPGPPGPLCKENCGRLCSGYYCLPTPTGTPPDFTSPAPSPTSGGNNGGGNNNGGNTGGGLPPGWGWITSISWKPIEPKPTSLEGLPTLNPVVGVPSPTESGASCVKSETWTITGGPKGDATATTSGCASWELPKKTDTPKPPRKPCVAVHLFLYHCDNDEPDLWYVQAWEDGVLTCEESYKGPIIGGRDFSCGNGANARILGGGVTFQYTDKDKSVIPMNLKGELYNDQLLCQSGKWGRTSGWRRETVWTGTGGPSTCEECPVPVTCGAFNCPQFDPKCKTLSGGLSKA